MAAASRQDLINYALRALGEPVVEINVDDSQIEDRIDEAIHYWQQYHWDGVEKLYMKAQITASRLYITTTDANQFPVSAALRGLTSGAKATVCAEGLINSSGNMIICKNIVGTFVAGESITDDNGHTAILTATNFLTLGVIDTHYFDLPDLIFGVESVMPFSNASSSKNLFDLQYQLRLNDLYDLTSTSLIYYKTVMSHLALLDLELNGKPLYRFNRMNGKLYVDMSWGQDVVIGDFIMVECYRAMDPTTATKVYNEPWLKHYATALIKKQWGMNGKKFQGMVLPGNVTMDFQGLYDEAMKEIADLEDELMNKSAPLEFMLG
jgi:hypothetical protein